MADEDLRGFVETYLLFGLLMLGLIGVALYLVFMNNSTAISGDYYSTLNETRKNLNIAFINSSATADKVLNSTSYTNPEASYLGSKDQVSSAYETMGSAKKMWSQVGLMLGILFSSNPEIVWIFGGMIVFSVVMLIIKFIRTGQ